LIFLPMISRILSTFGFSVARESCGFKAGTSCSQPSVCELHPSSWSDLVLDVVLLEVVQPTSFQNPPRQLSSSAVSCVSDAALWRYVPVRSTRRMDNITYFQLDTPRIKHREQR
jgi:hypothetical protein